MSHKFKIVLLGEGRVGKTSIVKRFVENTFDSGQISTIQASFLKKTLTVQKKSCTLAVWDTAGQEKFRALGPIYYRGAQGAVLVYDTTDIQTLDRVRDWIEELRKVLGRSVSLVIAGNKFDRLKKKQEVENEALELAKSVGAVHFFTSAKTGQGIEEMMKNLTERMVETVSGGKSNKSGKRTNFLIVSDSESDEEINNNSQNKKESGKNNGKKKKKKKNNSEGCC
ncbi:ras-related protein rab-21 [Anaeramoeba flamelloides]|uniref:Ras-related protein rab-21 n=1 Tax=Anaeramoeba flamelloides TaxID=1746091 RepID=A0AAV7ZSZ4_9EUKA|nr:ras-related protein rab-21 [Anaeramoeba flamelloides]KAJ6238015.1 ras-related protein rab-21 [Anaeramoeba flamelloides]